MGTRHNGWRVVRLLLLAVSLGPWAPLVAAPEPAAVSEPAPLSAQPLSEGEAMARSAELARRQAALEALIGQVGVYDRALVEGYADLAGFLAEQGEHAAAADLLRQALQVVRINDGLNAPTQAPILSELIQRETDTGNWQAVDDAHHLKFYVARRSLPPGSPERLAALETYGQWKQRVLKENLLRLNERNLSDEATELSLLYGSAIAELDAAARHNDPALIGLLTGKLEADMVMARTLARTPSIYFPGTVPQFINDTVCTNVRDASGNVVRSCRSVQVENPRYRQSQEDAKRMAVSRSTRQVDDTVARLQGVLDAQADLPSDTRTAVQMRIGEFQAESVQIDRLARRSMRF